MTRDRERPSAAPMIARTVSLIVCCPSQATEDVQQRSQRKAAQQDSIAKADAAFQKERAKVIATGNPKYSRGPVQSPEAAAKADPAGGAIAAAGGVKKN